MVKVEKYQDGEKQTQTEGLAHKWRNRTSPFAHK